VIAVDDLGGHAFESWANHETGKMWLKDFLPVDIQLIRIMSYGYRSTLSDESIDIDFLDQRGNLLRVLENSRRSAPVRILLDLALINLLIFDNQANSYLSKQIETAIDVYWPWDGWYLNASGKAI
jgi:hypothetical protein